MGGNLKVTVDGLRALSQSCTEQAGQLVASPPPPVAAASWQTSSTGVSTVNARASKVTTTMSARLTANAAKFSQAADDYQAEDEQSAVAVSAPATCADTQPTRHPRPHQWGPFAPDLAHFSRSAK